MSIPIMNPRQADLAARYRPRSTGAITQDTRNAGQKAIDGFNNWFRQTGLGNYLPDSEEAFNTALSLVAPFTAEQTGDTRGSLSARQSKQQTPLPFAADTALYAAGGAAVPLIGAGAKAVAKPYNAYRAMAPENRALYNSIVRGLYHGSRDTGANVAKPFTAASRDDKSWARNWFGGDMFGATGRNVLDPAGRQVAEGYTKSAASLGAGRLPSGLTQRGFPITRGAKFRLSEPMSDVANRKILDLTQGTLDEVDPALYQRLVNEFDDPDDVLNFADDLAKMDLTRSGPSMGGLHESRYSKAVRPIMEEFGYDTVKHLSGQLQGDIVTPVYAFLNPAGMQARPTLPSLGRAGEVLDTRVSELAQRGAEATSKAGASIREGGASTLDSLAAALSRGDMSSLPTFIREFAQNRTLARGAGYGFQDIRQFATNPQMDALLRKLRSINKLFSDKVVEDAPMVRGPFWKG